MGLFLAAVLYLGLFIGCNAQQTGNTYYACRDNEEYQMCQSPCEPSCSTINRGISVNCSRPCVSGCFCRRGLVRADDRSCVRPSDCNRPTCRENEEYSECGNACETNCTNLYEPVFCTLPCRRGCFCKPGFVRDSNGNCINSENCYRREDRCPVNEIYVDCVSYCNTCAHSIYCGRSLSCRPGCDCRPGFLRNSYGQCVPREQCYYDYWPSCGENEEYTECVSPCNYCEFKERCPYRYEYCEPGCDCKRGYLRDERSICVPERYCYGETQQCPKNEQYYPCVPTCRNTCETVNATDIVCDLSCRKGCFCKEGLVKRQDGACIRPQDCPVVCGPNEVYKNCGRVCEPDCDNVTSTSRCPEKCVKGCFCKYGFVRGPDGTCISPLQCPKIETCPRNEVFEECGTGCPRTCDNRNIKISCLQQCVRGCFCRRGFVRGPKGTCIQERFCPPKIDCGPNEVYKNCGRICEPECRNTSSSSFCPEVCAVGCFCRRGFVRGPDGACILPSECPIQPSCPKNEVFEECGTSCPKTCDNLNSSVPCTLQCVRGCFCRRGFVRGPKGICIPQQLCPPKIDCGPTEVYKNCGRICEPECRNASSPSVCPEVCAVGCFCRRGFVRGPDGACISPSECPIQPSCPKNEVFEDCGTSCPKTCDNLNSSVPCTLQCVRGCFCRRGFVRGPKGTCIPQQLCPLKPECGVNEIYKSCGKICEPECRNSSSSSICPDVCAAGCFCKDGFVRGPDGTCIEPSECPPTQTCRANEIFYHCIPTCGTTCEALMGDNTESCPRRCRAGCFCQPGFVRRDDGLCVQPKDCPVSCERNEVYKTCGRLCEPDCNNPSSSSSCSGGCVKGCFCKDGFVRSPGGGCIRPAQCPRPCGINEEFRQCGPACQLSCSTLQGRRRCPLPCVRGCFCKTGFIRGPGGRCIRPSSCPIANNFEGRRAESKSSTEIDTTTKDSRDSATVSEGINPQPPVSQKSPASPTAVPESSSEKSAETTMQDLAPTDQPTTAASPSEDSTKVEASDATEDATEADLQSEATDSVNNGTAPP